MPWLALWVANNLVGSQRKPAKKDIPWPLTDRRNAMSCHQQNINPVTPIYHDFVTNKKQNPVHVCTPDCLSFFWFLSEERYLSLRFIEKEEPS